LAEYVIADPSRQKTIAKNSKKALKAIMIPYSRVRSSIPDSFSAEGLNPDFLRDRAIEIESSAFSNQWQKADNERSATALRRLADIVHQIECGNSTLIPRPENGWGYLDMKGVRVSVNPVLVFSLSHQNVTKCGAVILNTGQDENLSLARSSSKYAVGDYLTALLYRMLEARVNSVGVPLHKKCYAIDIFRSTVYSAPSSYRTLMKHLEAACEMIALRWDTIPIDSATEEETAEGVF
jgi:hypothetical protein